MKYLSLFLLCLSAHADDAIWLPNIPGDATGTVVGPKQALDVNIVASSASPTPVVFPSTLPVSITSPLPLPVYIASPAPIIFPSILPVYIASGTPVPISGTVTANQGTPGATSSPWPVTVVSASPIPITGPDNANGSLNTFTVTATESPVPAPSNAVGVILESESGNSINIRWGVSNSAANILSSTVGVLMEPGRSVDYIPTGQGSYLHFIGVSAGSEVCDVQWVLTK